MKCEKAEKLMMKYMDGQISVEEAEMLNTHISACIDCKEAFFLYDELLNEMEDVEEVLAPEGFQEAVMAAVMALPKEERVSVYSLKYKVKVWVAGTFAVLLSIGALLIGHRDIVLSSLYQIPLIRDYVVALEPVAKELSSQSNTFVTIAEKFVLGLDQVLTSSAGIIFGGVVVLCVVQAVLVMRRHR
ncbi:MAG: anti-sigma factor family protein [Anaerotignaceae bacterium]